MLDFLNPKPAKVLSPVSTLAESISVSIAVDLSSFPQPPKAVYTPYSHVAPYSNQRRNQFRPRNANKGSTSYQLRQYAEATLGGGSLRKIVKLPEGEDENEWLAVNSKTSSKIIGHQLTCHSGRLLQSYQSSIRVNYRVLLAAIMSRDEGN